jgi:hypothetical protein
MRPKCILGVVEGHNLLCGAEAAPPIPRLARL